MIVFTNDTSLLKLKLTAPDAYHHALQYPPPERPRHKISENIRRRGKPANNNTKPDESSDQSKADGKDDHSTKPNESPAKPKPEGKENRQYRNNRKRNSDGRRRDDGRAASNNDNSSQHNSRTEKPEVDDIWPL